MDITNLRSVTELDPSGPQIAKPQTNEEAVTEETKKQIISSTVAFVAYCQEKNKKSDSLTLLNFHMWFDGLSRGRIETPIYSDVVAQLTKWHSQLQIPLYVCCNGWNEASKRFLAHTSHGDLTPYFSGYFDDEHGDLTVPGTYMPMLAEMKQSSPESVLFLTKNVAIARAAIGVGMNALLVLTHRRNIQKLDEEGMKLPRVRSLNDIDFV